MHLSRLYIENYRSIPKLDITFERGKNIVVGRNNSGKSNILKAIDLVLGEYSPTYSKSENINDNDFYLGNTESPIFIWCEISRNSEVDGSLEKIDFSSVKKSAFFRVYHDKHFTRDHRVNLTDFNRHEINRIFQFCSEEGQAQIDNNDFAKKWIGGKAYCKTNHDTEFADKALFAIAFICFKDENGNLQKELVLLYRENVNSDWILGINCNFRNILLQSAIIPAFRDPKDQLRITAYSWFGKLLKSYVKGDSLELANAFAAVKTASDGLFNDLKSKVSNGEINIAFPNTKISFQFNPDTKQDIHKSTLIYVDDGFNSELKDKGAGIQSAVTISLYDFYVRNIVHSGSSLLAVEEPELYLHPHGRRIISNRLDSFSEKGKNQVIITTHSTEFITSANENQNIISVTKNADGTRAKNINFDTPKRKQILIKKQNSEIFFADAVILSEGADKYFLEEAAREFGSSTEFFNHDFDTVLLGANWLNDYNISIINCGGKTELWKYSEILTELGIVHYTTADFDFLRDGLNDYLTNLKFSKKQIDSLNALKSRISAKVNGKYKHISELDGDKDLFEEAKEYLNSLRKEKIFIFSGELENFYKIKPAFSKEAGVIETLGKTIQDERPLSEYVHLSEYYDLFISFAKTNFGLTSIDI